MSYYGGTQYCANVVVNVLHLKITVISLVFLRSFIAIDDFTDTVKSSKLGWTKYFIPFQ